MGRRDLRLEVVHEHEHEEDHEHQTEAAARVIAPIAAMRPSRKGADQEKQDDDEEYGT
jgi:hypothetical protein